MNIAEAIEYDLECVREYASRLITFSNASAKDFVTFSSKRRGAIEYMPIDIASFARPDLVSSIYALVDYRLKTLCAHHHRKSKATETFEEFRNRDKGKTSDLARYRKYLQTIVGVDLAPIQASYKHLDLMRRIRNAYIHLGGYADNETSKLVAAIPGISMNASLLIVSEAYVHESIDHASHLLLHIAQA